MKNDVLKLYLKLRKSLLTEKARLEARLNIINETLGAASKSKLTRTGGKGKKRSAEARANIAAGQKKRWAERKKAAGK